MRSLSFCGNCSLATRRVWPILRTSPPPTVSCCWCYQSVSRPTSASPAFPFEREVIDWSTFWELTPDVRLRTCSAEDLVVYKLIAARPGDIQDVISVVRRQGTRLDVARIRHWGAQFAELKEDPDLLRPFEDALRKAGLRD